MNQKYPEGQPDDQIKKKVFASFFRTGKAKFNRCLELSMSCKNKAIRAHSVQNSRILENLIDNGHVITFKARIDKNKGPQIDLGLVGRDKATTFTGLCSVHDQELFAAIDNEEISLDNKQHLFLLAYRSVHRELHATMEAASKIQSAYLQLLELGLDPADQPSEAGMTAVGKMVIAWQTWKYKTDFDEVFLKENYDLICHDTFTINLPRPTIAVSALFSMDDFVLEDDVLRVVLNVIPVTENHTHIIFSYRKQDTDIARVALDRVLNTLGTYQLYEISRLILNNCENFVLNPKYVDDWSEAKRETIRKYFVATILKGDMEFQSSDLYLF